MKNLSVLTSNAGKFNEIQSFFKNDNIILTHIAVELEEIQDVDAIKVITHKAQQAIKLGYNDCIVEDTALYIDGMNRLPGIFVKWFLHEIGADGILKLAQCMGNRAARAETIFAYIDKYGTIILFHGITHGHITEPQGTFGLGYDKIFTSNGSNKTFGQMTIEEKRNLSPRAKALAQLRKHLVGQL